MTFGGGGPLEPVDGLVGQDGDVLVRVTWDPRRPIAGHLLELVGATHLPPYSSQEPQLGVVERVTIAFLDRYLKRTQGSLERLRAAGNLPGVATLDANP